MMKALRNLVRKDDGASMVEYTVMLGLLIAATIGLVTTVGGQVESVWNNISSTLSDEGITEAEGDSGEGTPTK